MQNHIYKQIEITGSSNSGIQDAIEKAIAKVSQTVRNLRWFELVNVRGHIDGGKIAHWQATLKVGFSVEVE